MLNHYTTDKAFSLSLSGKTVPTIKEVMSPVKTYECINCLRTWSTSQIITICIDCQSKSIIEMEDAPIVIF